MPLTSHAALAKDATNGKKAPLMQHRHFAWIAAELRSHMPGGYDPTAHYMERSANEAMWVGICESFADKLSETNPNFDHDRFIRACGV